MKMQDTIFALSSGNGFSGIAIIRISGARALEIAQAMTDLKKIKPRHAHFTQIFDPKTKEIIDDIVLLYFKAPASATGEDLVEFHCHGSPAVTQKIFSCFSIFENLRLAEAGEFTKRSVLSGKMSLDEAEGISDLIHSHSEAQRKQALSQMRGGIRQKVNQWREDLTHIMAMLTADIDFAEDEDDVSNQILEAIRVPLAKVTADIKTNIENKSGIFIRDGITFLFVGAPNAGKSSLLNALTGDETAIVTPIAGTTRDFVTDKISIGNHIITLKDAPGLRESSDQIEQIGIERTIEQISNNNNLLIPILVLAPDVEPIPKQLLDIFMPKIEIIIHTKADIENTDGYQVIEQISNLIEPIKLSSKNGDNLEVLKTKMEEICNELSKRAENTAVTNERHLAALEKTALFLDAATKMQSDVYCDTALLSEELRLASRSLGNITGDVDVEGLLDIVFSTFCIGK